MAPIKQTSDVAGPVIDNGVYAVLALSDLSPMENYREKVNKTYLKELTASIKEKGVLQPITVRLVDQKHQIVAGNCRYLAATDAGLAEIPAIIKQLSDEEALEVQIIENGQRDNPNPMDDANGFQKLIDMGQHTLETLAARLGKTVSFVNARLKLLSLPEEAQKAVRDESITVGHAMVLMMLKNPADQKEILNNIISGNWTVQTAMSNIRNYSYGIQNAEFDATECATCQQLTSNQTILFPGLKKTGQCTDRKCYTEKTRKHFESLIEEKRKAGFPIVTKPEEILNLANGGRKSCKIAAPGTPHAYNVEKPKKYKTECAKCTEHHAYYFTLRESNNGLVADTGEICLNRKCLDKMNSALKPKPKSASKSEPETIPMNETESSPSRREKARFCRDRFLKAIIPAKVEASPTLQKRLTVYHLLCRISGHADDHKLLEKYAPIAVAGYRREQAIYHVVMNIDAEKLDTMIANVITDLVLITEPKVLLMLAPEANIDMTADFGPDADFLKCMKKDELVEYAAAAGIDASLQADDKKGDMLKKLTALDLRGKLTESLTHAIQVEDIVAETAQDKEIEGGEDNANDNTER